MNALYTHTVLIRFGALPKTCRVDTEPVARIAVGARVREERQHRLCGPVSGTARGQMSARGVAEIALPAAWRWRNAFAASGARTRGQHAQRPVVLLQAPQVPSALAFSSLCVPLDKLMWLRRKQRTPCGARTAYRRPRLAVRCCFATAHPLRRAQASGVWNVAVSVRQLAGCTRCVGDDLAARRKTGGIAVDMLKRRGPNRTEPSTVTLQPSPILHGRSA